MLFAELLGYWSVTNDDMTKLDAMYYALGMLGLNFVAMMCQHHNNLFVLRFSMRVKVACSSLLFRKVNYSCYSASSKYVFKIYK